MALWTGVWYAGEINLQTAGVPWRDVRTNNSVLSTRVTTAGNLMYGQHFGSTRAGLKQKILMGPSASRGSAFPVSSVQGFWW